MVMRLMLYMVWMAAVTLAILGAVLIVYGFVSSRVRDHWGWLEERASWISAFLTLFGTLLAAASVYFYSPRPPGLETQLILAPPVIISCILAFVCLVRRGELPPLAVCGFGLLAIAGGVLRSIPFAPSVVD